MYQNPILSVQGVLRLSVSKAIEMIKFGLIITSVIIILDQITKYLVMDYLDGGFIVITNFFNLVYVFNTGISFSLFSNDTSWAPLVFALVGCLFVLLLMYWLYKADNKIHASGLGLIIGGALGNIIDRLVHGAVFDFLDFHLYDYHFPAFNIADTSISFGVFIVIIDSIFIQESKKNVT
ncbi:MAG: Lipoprotein signal peptidase [Alphaproteobacteria bacterium MarineAlpha2_Bin1]|nr:MAG: Lipoprotein signal peptidase [Alphaproteobacteria bacterium MarineAlpha2_Bin1]